MPDNQGTKTASVLLTLDMVVKHMLGISDKAALSLWAWGIGTRLAQYAMLSALFTALPCAALGLPYHQAVAVMFSALTLGQMALVSIRIGRKVWTGWRAGRKARPVMANAGSKKKQAKGPEVKHG